MSLIKIIPTSSKVKFAGHVVAAAPSFVTSSGDPFWYNWGSLTSPPFYSTTPSNNNGIQLGIDSSLKHFYIVPRENLTSFSASENYPPSPSSGAGTIDARNCTNLQTLAIHGNNLNEVFLGNNPNLKYLSVGGNFLNNVDASNLPNLEVLYANFGGNYQYNVDITNSNNIRELDVSHGPLFTLTGLTGFSTYPGDKMIRMGNTYKSKSVIEGYLTELPAKPLGTTGTWRIYVNDQFFDITTLNRSIAQNKGWQVCTGWWSSSCA